MSNREPRDFSLEERRRQFLAFKKAHPPNATEVSEAKTQWHLVADPMTVEQVDQIPPGQPGIESRVGPFWVKYFHRERHQVVVARGLFDHEHWTWTVRFTPEADHDYRCRVAAQAWAFIVYRGWTAALGRFNRIGVTRASR
ncbi:MAG: hypothetical protein QOH35_1443 [Acidobacteriaceae bacterium]|jgi:hypothetical protein|nr:hypothetical protein [Acidobacteriaceae bacterium]